MKNAALALLLLVCSARCASIVHGRYQNVPVRSTPSGAYVQVACGDVPTNGGMTPTEVKLARGAEHCSITLSKTGYAEQMVNFTRVHSAVAWSNLVPGLAVGLAIGVASAPIVVFNDSSDTENKANTAALAGTIVGTGIGVAVDRHTGALYRQVPSSVDVALEGRP
jgi:hypothetical protein